MTPLVIKGLLVLIGCAGGNFMAATVTKEYDKAGDRTLFQAIAVLCIIFLP